MEFMLDTDTASFIIKKDPVVLEKSLENLGQWCISTVVYQELMTGLLMSKSTRRELVWTDFLRRVEVVPFAREDALATAEISADLRSKGVNIGKLDEQIAGHAVSAGLTLVSSNFKHYSQVAGLSLESWR